MTFQAANARPEYIQHTVAGGNPNTDPLLTPALFPSGTLLLDQTTGILWVLRRIGQASATWISTAAAGGPPTGPAGGDLSGTYPDPQVANIHLAGGQSSGDIMWFDGTNWVRIAASGTLDNFLRGNPTGAPAWADPTPNDNETVATTTNNSPTTVVALQLAENTAYSVLIQVAARQTTGGTNFGAFATTGSVFRIGSGVATLGAETPIASYSSAGSWTAVLAVTGNSAAVTLVGSATQTVQWKIYTSFVSV